MSTIKEIVVLSAVRTAVGGYGGSLKDVAPGDLAATAIRAAVERSGVTPADVGHTVLGHVIHTEPRDMYISRYASVTAGLPVDTPAFTLNRLCGSGLQAIVSAAQQIETGHSDVAVAGGAEVMSRAGYLAPSLRWGARMSDAKMVDMMVGALTDPFEGIHMGVTAENIAEKWGITREDQDALAVESHRRAAQAWENGYFADQIVPVELKTRKGTTLFERDEHFRTDATLEGMAKLRAVFKKDGSVTAGNASGLNDAASAVVLATREYADAHGLKPLARLVGYSHAGCEPAYMGIGPVPAVKRLLADTGLTVADFDVLEVNEAFAAQAIAVCRDLDLPMDKTNPNGSGISLGHPIGATGSIVTTKAIHELQRTGGRYALVTMCIGGGQGIAAAFERL
ncbi:MAG: acetyl-CoA C-acyltransferase family protein [Sedimenticola sp.]|uniref:Acetyl-CoA C-acyltransferase family protein n=1 Tax=Sedimenticola thiotaurini TaxID=1543721 RepID=A0A558CMQ1_9GAMM|nr:acetyl-CoA C-acyltransferase family protein [Sedimenticola sp.]MCW8882411.1 acetyl-CoA C-acyltransferase family protein [Sedimenticola sp.]MCW8976227.1 acetyl-CoA C-acyltransferase family protein [Sedimenticola sp.]MCW9021625.1 acetyl-CoA C-acyltransferase family protein [Sedimenticola sp.]TVT50049.1 MAG: acetyl-CoA C-acyltransferase family protein [Sedimenticola thiotaurini]